MAQLSGPDTDPGEGEEEGEAVTLPGTDSSSQVPLDTPVETTIRPARAFFYDLALVFLGWELATLTIGEVVASVRVLAGLHAGLLAGEVVVGGQV